MVFLTIIYIDHFSMCDYSYKYQIFFLSVGVCKNFLFSALVHAVQNISLKFKLKLIRVENSVLNI